MQQIWNFFLRQQRFTLLLLGALIVAGFYSLATTPKESSPEVKVPIGIVTTLYPGASASDVERLITDVIEERLVNLEDMDQYTSTSREGLSSVIVEFEASADLDDRMRALRDAVALAEPQLPQEALDPVVSELSFSNVPIIVMSLSADLPAAELKRMSEDVQDALEQIKGVSEVRVSGARNQEVQVQTDKRRLDQYGLSLNELVGAIQSSHVSFPVGSISSDEIRYALRLDAEIKSAEDVALIPVRSVNGTPVYVRDVADVIVDFAKTETVSRVSVNGEPSQNAVSFSVYKKTGGDIVAIVDEAKKTVEALRAESYPEASLSISVDNAKEIDESLGSLLNDGVSTIIIIFFFLYALLGWREALLAGLSIPLTMLLSFIGLQFFGSTINFLSLFSLILALGILVDTGIVITEGMHEQLQQGKTPLEAAKACVREFQWPLISGTLTTISAFMPMLLMGGIMGEFVKHIPITVNLVLLGSLFTALALLPLIGALFLRAKDANRKPTLSETYVQPRIERLRAWYDGQLRRFLDSHRLKRNFVLALIAGFVISVSLPITGLLKIELFPADDFDFFYIDVVAPVGTTLAVTDTVAREIEDWLYADSRIESYIVQVGSGNSQSEGFIGGGATTHLANFTINLYEDRDVTSQEVVNEYREKVAVITKAEVSVTMLNGGPPTGAPVLITFTGPSLEELDRLAMQTVDILEAIPGAVQIKSSIEEAPLEFVFTLNREEVARAGLTSVQLAQILRTSVQGTEASEIRLEGDDVDVRVALSLNPYSTSEETRTNTTIDEVRNLTLSTPNGDVPLSRLVEVEVRPGNTNINHLDGDRTVNVTAYTQGVTATEIFAAFTEASAEQIELPSRYTMKAGGEAEDVAESFRDLFRALFLGLFLMASILVVQFNSFRQPFFLLASLPLTLIAVFPGLLLFGHSLSFPSFIGVVSLSGIVVNDALVLIDRINRLRYEGMEKKAAIIAAATSRLQPILLTAISTIAGILPLALGDPTWGSLGFAVVSGLSIAPLASLGLVPMLYLRFGEETLPSRD